MTVALSGGVDSTVLLHLMTALRDKGYIPDVLAVHVHHGLSRHADRWAEHCASICDQWQVPLNITKVTIENRGYGLEQAARNARYQVFVKTVHDGSCLLQGHHRDDQAETILLRLFRGTGIEGIQGIPEQRCLGEGVLFRPLLNLQKKRIENYAIANQLIYVEDDSNTEDRYSRNFLRNSLIPLIDKRWPKVADRLVDFAQDVTQVNDCIQKQTSDQLASCVDYRPQWLPGRPPLIKINALYLLDVYSRQRVLREWLKYYLAQAPSREMIDLIFREVVEAEVDAKPMVNISKRYIISRYQKILVVLDQEMKLVDFESMQWDWQQEPVIKLGDWVLSYDRKNQQMAKSGALPKKALWLKRRCHMSPDDKFAIVGRQGRKTLKKWLQEYKVPPWLREHMPFVCDAQQMLVAPGLWRCDIESTEADDPITLDWVRQH